MIRGIACRVPRFAKTAAALIKKATAAKKK
jgi:hypothetical protein